MNGRFAIFCPGQGAQHPGMFDLARNDARVSKMIDQWWKQAQGDLPLEQVLADDATMYANRLAQPLIVTATLAMWEAIRDRIPMPALVAGYSIGEVAAYGVAAALTPSSAIRLASQRAKLMDACLLKTGPHTMIAVSHLSPQAAGALLEKHEFHVAIQTGEDRFIAGGRQDSAGNVEQALAQLGAGVTRLPVEIASHTPYMEHAVLAFEGELQRHGVDIPEIPVIAGISAAVVRDSSQAVATLSRQIAEPIRWMECMDACMEAGITVVLELGPGAALARMMQARHPGIECRSVADFRTLKGIEDWLLRHLG